MQKTIVRIGFVIVVFWAVVVVASGAGWNPLGVSWNFSNSGAFGDSFGPVGAIMAGLAAVAAFEALREQRAEIKRITSREDAEDKRRAELDALNERQRRLRQAIEGRQIFEQTFFNLLEALREIVKETDVGLGETRKTSRDAFKAFTERLSGYFQGHGTIEIAWKILIKNNKNDLNHYFRFLYHIIRYVDLQDNIDRYFYIRLVRSGLSESELLLIAVNCAYGEGIEKFKPLIEKYALLHNLSETSIENWSLRDHYDSSAFSYEDL